MADFNLLKCSEETIKNHLNNYYAVLKSGQPFNISSLVDTYKAMAPSLHPQLNSPDLDISALNYSILRLPECIYKTEKVIFTADIELLKYEGFQINKAVKFEAPRRRRTYYFNKNTKTLVCLISSDSDIDDFINCLIAYYIEINKISLLLNGKQDDFIVNEDPNLLNLTEVNWNYLKKIFGASWPKKILSFIKPKDIVLKSLYRNEAEFYPITQKWWSNLVNQTLIFDFASLPVYFVSSNFHSLLNIIGGVVRQKQNEIFDYVLSNHPDLNQEWLNIKSGGNIIRVNDFLYYISQIYFKEYPKALIEKDIYEQSLGIKKINSKNELECEAQIIPVSSLIKSNFIDPYIKINDRQKIENSKALIVNIDYPLGYDAFYIMETILNSLKNLKGIYIVGKAAILDGEIGDIQIPKTIFDERTHNFYSINNAFNNNVEFTSLQGSILKNQKAVSVYGPFLENQNQIKNYVDFGFNIIEMESGPYLSSIVKNNLKLDHISQDSIFNIENTPYDLGIINYASDNPLTQNLGVGSLALKGIEPTYFSLLTVLQRIIDLESK